MDQTIDRNRLAVDLAMTLGIYTAWTLLVVYGNDLPLILLFVLGGYVTCLHGSLQHIAVHGYPTRWRWLNTLLAYPPLAFYFPYPAYRESHLAHHRVEELTNVETDPESLYLSKEHWNSLNSLSKAIYRVNFTLAGRLLIGPFVSQYLLWKGESRRMLAGNRTCAANWFFHIAALLAISLLIQYWTSMPLWKYLLCFAYPGISLTLLRSYTEHRWSADAAERSIIVEGSAISRLLYLNNNYHWVHHENPKLPWQDMSKEFNRRRAEILNSNGNFYYKGYFQILAHLFKDKLIDPIHPLETSEQHVDSTNNLWRPST